MLVRYQNAVVRQREPGSCVLVVPYVGRLSMAARAAITVALRQRTIEAHDDPLSSVLAIATDGQVSVFADASPPVLARWMTSGRLLACATEALLYVAPQDDASALEEAHI